MPRRIAGQRAGSPSERRAQFDGIGYQQEDPAKAARREQEERDRQRAEEEAEQVCTGWSINGR